MVLLGPRKVPTLQLNPSKPFSVTRSCMKGQLGRMPSKVSLAFADRRTVSALGNGTWSRVPPECEVESSSAQGDATGGVKAVGWPGTSQVI